jgi:hypothetical protein
MGSGKVEVTSVNLKIRIKVVALARQLHLALPDKNLDKPKMLVEAE